MADTLKVELVTPERRVLSCDAVMVALPGSQGELGVLPGHLPLLTTLRPGTLTITQADAKVETFAVSTGFAEVMPNRVTILTDSAEAASAIDLSKAREALSQAEQALAAPSAEPSASSDETAEALAATLRAQADAEAARTLAFELARARVDAAETANKGGR